MVRSVLKAEFIKNINEYVKNCSPKILEPIGLTEPFYKSGANRIIGFNKCASVPSLGKYIITESSECPNLGTIIGTVYTISDVTTTSGLWI